MAEPIYLNAVSGELTDWMKAQVIEKIALLFTPEIDPSDEHAGLSASISG